MRANSRSAGRAQAGSVDGVLNRDRQAVQRADIRCARQRCLAHARPIEGIIRNRDNRVQRGIQLLDSPQMRLNNFDGGNGARTDQRDESCGGFSC